MTRVEITGSCLKVEILGWDKLWSFKSRLNFPIEHVVEVRRWEKERDGGWGFRGLRAPGTSLPGVIVAGTYHRKGEHIFYDVHKYDNAIVIELRDEWYARMIVEVPDPEATLQLIQNALKPQPKV